MTARRSKESLDGNFEELYTVSEITAAIRQSLESEFPSVNVMGEIANFKVHTSGHLYLSLRDESSLLRVVVFSRYAGRVAFGPENGMTAVASGRISHYGGGGQTQLIATSLRSCGYGAIEIQVRRLLRRLMEEGLTDPARKKPLPPFPERIAVVTSPTGAALKDIRRTLARRWPLARIVHLPAAVQGSEAEQSLLEAFADLDGIDDVDVVILARGGGSAEDLRVFNTENVARAVAACRRPVVTGIGHEVDTTVCDYVSDLRAATPTAAAELVAPDIGEVAARLEENMRRLMAGATAAAAHRLSSVELLMRSAVFHALERRLDRERIASVDALDRLESWWTGARASILALIDALPSLSAVALEGRIGGENVRLANLSAALARLAVPEKTAFLRQSLNGTLKTLTTTAENHILVSAGRLDCALRALRGLEPARVLQRGYSYCTSGDGKTVVGRMAGLVPGDKLGVHFHDGRASCNVETTRKEAPWRRKSRTSKGQ